MMVVVAAVPTTTESARQRHPVTPRCLLPKRTPAIVSGNHVAAASTATARCARPAVVAVVVVVVVAMGCARHLCPRVILQRLRHLALTPHTATTTSATTALAR